MPIQVGTQQPQLPTGGSFGSFRDAITVTLVSATVTTDDLGDSTEEQTTQDIPGCLFAPRASSERADPRSPAVISGATLYLPAGIAVRPTDYFVIAVGMPFDGTWQVDGEPGYWGSAGVEVAIKRTA